jgi:single-strand DNA-binding protein
MAGVNKVILIGNLGKDPEVKHLESGRAVANFSLATSETYKNKQGERVTNTEWHNIVLWSPLAELAEKYLKKGSQVFIEGKITTRNYDDKDSITRYITEVVGREMTFLGGGASQTSNPQEATSATSSETNAGTTETAGAPSVASNDTDDLPF